MPEILPDEQVIKKRKFITIICIVAFVINGFSLLTNEIVYKNPEVARAASIEKMEAYKIKLVKYLKDVSTQQQFTVAVNNAEAQTTAATIGKLAMYNIIAAFICLVGISMLFKRNKFGFHLFIIGTLFSILAPFLLMGGSLSTLFSAAFSSVFWIIILIILGKNIQYLD